MRDYASLIQALRTRQEAFHLAGCRLADLGLKRPYAEPFRQEDAEKAFCKAREGVVPSAEEAARYRSALLLELAPMNWERGWVQQLHLGAIRNVNSPAFHPSQGKNRGAWSMNLTEARVLVTPTTFGLHDPRLRMHLEESVGEVIYNPFPRALSSEELIPLVQGVDGFIAGLDRIDASVIKATSRLKVISRYGVGLDNVDLEAATAKGIVVTNTPGANSAAVAELTMAFILGLARGFCRAVESTKGGLWPRLSGVGLKGKTVGIVGFGRIGREVASRLKGFGCRILVFDPQVKPREAIRHGVSWRELEELLGSSDIVSLHLPLSPSTRGMVDREFLGKMKRGAFLVNTARGELLDEQALLQALGGQHLAGAALDCLSQEPRSKDYPLLQDPRVMVTPHMGAHTDEATVAMGWMSLEACLSVLRGQRLPHVVNPQAYGARRELEGQ